MQLREKLMLLYHRSETSANDAFLNPDDTRVFLDSVVEIAFSNEKPEVKNKITGILNRFMSAEFFFRKLDYIKERGITPLANRESIIQTDFLLELGDCCLFATGILPNVLEKARDARGISYYTGYGINSYVAAIDTPGASQRRELIGTFADNFRDYSERLREVSQAPPIRFK